MTPIEYAGFKRVMEWYMVDPDFRSTMEKEIPELLFQMGMESKHSLILQAIHDVLQGRFGADGYTDNPYLREYVERNAQVTASVRERIRRETFASDGIWQYANVIRNRCRMESRLIRMHPNIYYYPVCFELSEGCRVQCSFCGFGAEAWKADFRYTPENAELWRTILQITRDLLGEVIMTAPCYFATEPLDNPDYEAFLKDMKVVLGGIPQTTTAVAERDPERIRNLIRIIGEKELKENNALRFSVRNLWQFRQIMDLYTPEELECVELIPNNPESVFQYASSGRAAEHDFKIPEKKAIRYSISCLAGIRVNMVTGTISFVEPELPDQEYPFGIHVREKVSFHDAESYREGVIRLFRSYGFGTIPYYALVQLNRNVRIEYGRDEIRLLGDAAGYRMDAHQMLVEAMQKLQKGIEPVTLAEELGVTGPIREKLFSLLNELYIRGYLCLKQDDDDKQQSR